MSPFLPTFSTSERSTTRTSHLVRAGHDQRARRGLGDVGAIVAADHALEGFLVVGVAAGRGLGGGGAGVATATPSRPVAGTPVLVLGDAGRGPAEAGADLVGHDLDLRALLTVGVLPRALVEAAGDDDPRALGQALRGVLGHLLPAHHVEERRCLLPLLGLAVHPAPVDGQPEAGRGLAAGCEAQLGVAGDVAHHGDRVSVRHLTLSVRVSPPRPPAIRPPPGWNARTLRRVAG